MGSKLNRSPSKRLKTTLSGTKRSSEWSGFEPAVKKPCNESGKQFLGALRGHNPLNAVKSWLYLVSNSKEQAQLDKETALLEHNEAYHKPGSIVLPRSREKGDVNEGNAELKDEEETLQANKDDNGALDAENSCVEYIDSFLHSGGTPADFINIIPAPSDATYANSRHILKALSKVLLRIAAVHHDKISKASKTCQEFLNSYTRFINGMLECSKSFAQRKLVLELFTAMVILDSRLGKEILVSSFINGESVQNFTSSAVPMDVRTAYHNFLIALMMEVDDSLITTVINKPWLLMTVMDDLHYDSSETLVLFLTTIEKAIVKNPHITKTSKLAIFDVSSILCLLRLYNWKGPQNRPRARSQWDVKKVAAQKRPLADIDGDEAEVVANAVHELLLLLLTDYRYGIIFRDPNIGFKGDRLNSLVLKVLQKIGQFWENSKTSTLISSVLAACPDAMSTTMVSMEPYVIPRSSPKWFKCVDFLKQVICAQRPGEVLQRQASKLSSKKFSQAAMEMCVPPHVVKALCSGDAAALCDPDPNVAKLVCELLLCMLKKMSNFMEEVQIWPRKGILIKFVAVRHLIRDMMPQHFPLMSSIERAWRHWSDQLCQDNEEQLREHSTILSVLSSILEFLDSYRSVCPSALETLFVAQSTLKLCMTNTVLSVTDSEDAALLRNRFYHLLLAAHDNSFSVENPAVREPLLQVFTDLLSPSPHVRSLARSVLLLLIERSRSLEGSRGESFIWISAYEETFHGKEEYSSELKETIVESMLRATSQYSKYLDVIAQCEEQSPSILNTSQNLLKDVFMRSNSTIPNLHQGISKLPNARNKSYTISTVSPWLPALLEALAEKYDPKKKKKQRFRQLLENFLIRLIVRLLFRFVHPLPPLHLILRDASEMLPSTLTVYLRGWLPGSEPQPLHSELFEPESMEVQLSLFLYSHEIDDCIQDKMNDLIKSVTKPSKQNSSPVINEAQLNIIQLVYFSVFHLTQWTQLNSLTIERAKNCEEILRCVLEVASQFESSGETKVHGLVVECLEVVFSHPLLLQHFSPLAKHCSNSSSILTDLLISLARFAKGEASGNAVLDPYKHKLLAAIISAVKKNRMLKQNPVPMMQAFPSTFQEASELLDLISDLPSSSLIFLNNDEYSELSFWSELVVHLLTCVANLRSQESLEFRALSVLSASTVSHVALWLVELLKLPALDSSPLQYAFLTYLKSCPQQTKHVPKQLLASLLNANRLRTAGLDLVAWLSLCTSSRDIIDLLKAACKPGRSLLERPNILLPVLGVVLKSEEAIGVVGSNWFKTIYDHLKIKIEKCVANTVDHPDWLQANINAIVVLVKFGMNSESREKILETLEANVVTLSVDKRYHLQLIVAVLNTHPSQLLRHLLRWLADALKKHDDVGNQGPLVESICLEVLNIVNKKLKRSESVVNLRESKEWLESIKLALKLSLRLSDVSPPEEIEFNDDEIKEENITSNKYDVSSLLLKVLSSLFNVFYLPDESHEHVAMVYKLTTLHSDFVNAMMDSSPSKFELVNFLRVLMILNPSIVDSTHVPVILAAYGATLSKTDCALLILLQDFERTGISLSHYRPYLWGKEGANHYSIWSDTSHESGYSLWQQPKPNQVLGLLSKELVKSTITKFPLHRKLNIDECRCDPVGGVYDPSFYLPLFSHLLAPESPVPTARFVRSGALAITFSSLASHDVAVRAAAYTTLARFLSNLHLSSGSNKQVLLHLLSSVQKGVLSFGEENPQLPSISSVFLAQTALELANPLSNLYQSLMNFILTKPVMKLDTVPEFWTFLHSENVHHVVHRCWILRVISNGLRSRTDFELCLKVVAFKLLPAFYSCCLSDSETKFLILRCLRSAVQDQYGACCLVRDYALISWLHQAILVFGVEDIRLISEMVQLIGAMWVSLRLPHCRTIPVVAQPGNKILPLMFALMPKMTAQLGVATLLQFICNLSSLIKSLKSDVQKYIFSTDTILALIDVCSPFVHKRELFEITKLGYDFVNLEDGSEFSDELFSYNESRPCDVNKLQGHLKYLLIQWVKQVQSQMKTEITIK